MPNAYDPASGCIVSTKYDAALAELQRMHCREYEGFGREDSFLTGSFTTKAVAEVVSQLLNITPGGKFMLFARTMTPKMPSGLKDVA